MEKVTEKPSRSQAEGIHIHLLQTEEDIFSEPASGFFRFLSEEERDRYQEFEQVERQKEFFWSRLLLRRVLAFYVGKRMEDWNFGYGDHGKPFLKDSEWQFSLSHSEGLIACSVSRQKIGIDVEKMTGRNWPLLAGRFFSQAEKEFLFSQDEELQMGLFYQIFTRKEAALKAEGNGLERISRQASVPLPLAEEAAAGGWDYLTKFLKLGGYWLAHAAQSTGWPPRYRFFEWTPASLGIQLEMEAEISMEGTYGHLHG